MSTNQEAWSYTVVSIGGADFFRSVSIPIAKALDESFPEQSSVPTEHKRSTSPLFVRSSMRAVAGLGLADAIFGVLVFLGGWGAKRLLDDVYELKVRPRVRNLLGEPPEKQGLAPGKRAGFLFTIWHERFKRGIVVAALGDSTEGILKSEARITDVHLQAEQLLAFNAPSATITLYVIDNGVPGDALNFEGMEAVYEYLAMP